MTLRVRLRREELQLAQQDLASIVGLSRQALSAIESGRSVPSVDVAVRIARALGTSVEALFGGEGVWSLKVEDAPQSRSRRCVVAMCRGKWIAHSLGDREGELAADGLIAKDGRIEMLRPPEVAQENVLIMGCAPSLGVLSERLNAERGAGRFVWLPNRSRTGLDAVVAGTAHIAGLHLTDDRGREANVAQVRRVAPRSTSISLITLAHWEVGLVVPAGNPRRIRRASDVAVRGTRLVNRERGASPRRVLERRLRQEGTRPPVDHATARGHRDVARLVEMGMADVGPAVREVAIAFGLGFVPFGEERFDLALPTELLGTPPIRRMLDLLTSSRARGELSALGYDPRETGRRVAMES